MRKRTTLIMVLVLAVCLMFTACSKPEESGKDNNHEITLSAPEKVITLKLGTKMSLESLEGQGHLKFAELVEQKTDGAVKINVYPSEQLGDATTQINNLKLGTQELYAESGNYFSGFTNMLDITNIPFLFQSNEQYIKLVQGEFGQKQLKILEENGFKVLTTERNWIRGPYRVICSVKPLKTVEDIKGLRFRTHESDLYMNCWSRLGAKPIVFNWSEVYLAIKQGNAEAVASPVSQIMDMAFHEVAPYITDISEYPQEIFIVMNLDVFNKLTKEQQQAVIDAANETAEWSNSKLDAYVQDCIKKMEEAGATFYKMDTKPATEALLPYFRELEAKGTIPEGLLETLGY